MSFIMLSEDMGFYSSNKGSFRINLMQEDAKIEEERLSGMVAE